MIKFKKSPVALSVIIATTMLTACGGGGSDQDSQASNSTSFTGLVIDDAISGSYVYPDLNGNGVQDSFEKGGATNSEGRFSFSVGLTNQLTLQSIGGTDTATQESWDGSLSNVIDTSSTQTTLNLTPLTTMATSLATNSDLSLSIAQAQERVLVAVFGQTGTPTIDLNTYNYITQTGSDSNAVTMRQAAVKLAQTVEAGNRVLNNAAESVNGIELGSTGVEARTNDASSFIYDSIAAQLTSSSSADNFLSSLETQNLSTIITTAKTSFQQDIINTHTNVNTTSLQAALDAAEARARQAAESTARVADDYLDQATNESLFKTASILTATVVEKADQGADVGTLNAYGVNIINSNILLSDFDNEIRLKTVDVGLLEDQLGDGTITTGNLNTIVEVAALEDISSDIWSNQFLSMSGQDSSTEKGRVILFFDAYSESAGKGNAKVCYAFKDGSEEQTGLIEAEWTKVGEEVVEVTSAYGNFQIKAYRVQAVATADTGKYLGLGTPGAPGSSEYGNFLFTSSAFDENATWYSDIVGDSTAKDTAAGWGLASYTSSPSNGDGCKSFTASGVNGGNAFLTVNVF
ncbi:hypothetical protein GV054_04860 [Marinomonas mediterranea]|uniref:hypothetical protein n=1 Tax=Marinomonas mediterranea TaxID=119864 RepID=UPI00234B387A|nr:hypothetical protein [Marinomonas mediterranea]WCN12379.1 hypothetical protein GV054_04860 [Marinomonas mediterranea]